MNREQRQVTHSCETCPLNPAKEAPDNALVQGIAKYRKAGNQHEWYLTNFTMEQVEGRLKYLEAENLRLRQAEQGASEKGGEDE